jgi:UDPglucose 6-dehydrogenase
MIKQVKRPVHPTRRAQERRMPARLDAARAKKIVVIGTGYVGLVTGTGFAEWGHNVICVDNNPAIVETLKKGNVPIFEPGLKELIDSNVAAGRLSFVGSIAGALDGAAAAFIAVGTPPRAEGDADLSYVYKAAEEIGRQMTGDIVVVNKSTVPVGTGDEIEQILRDIQTKWRVSVVSNPEFLREGAAVEDFLLPDRVVVGVEDEFAEGVLRGIYAPVADAGLPILFARRRTAEIIKYAANAFLAVKIALINEFADLCEAAGGDVVDVALAVGLDHRIGMDFLKAGPGFGGSCFPKDTTALLRTAQEHNVSMRVVESAVSGNHARKRAMAQKVIAALGGNAFRKRIAILGLAFKPDTDDMREAPSIPLIEALQRAGARITAYDPEAATRAKEILPDLVIAEDPYACAKDADAVVIVTGWKQFKDLDLDRLRGIVRQPILIDLQNLLEPAVVREHGFNVHTIGRQSPEEAHAAKTRGRPSTEAPTTAAA